ncbi:MAG: DapH/DapD/GlmU-related protein [Candidatus Binatia bacterium]
MHNRIGNDVWIGFGVTIVHGCDIPDGCVIAAGSVVTRSPPPYSIVGGVPARVIRPRFDTKTVSRLIALQWWNLSPSHLRDLDFRDVSACLDKLERLQEESRQAFNPPVVEGTLSGLEVRHS